jgi:hypothetical protein
MTSMKALAIIALLVGGTSLAVAQNPAQNPPHPGIVPGTPAQSAAPTAAPSKTQTTKHPKKMYMSTKSHKGSKMTPASSAKPQMKQ